MGRIESVTAEELVSDLNELEEDVSLEELEYTGRSITYGRQFNLEFESEDQLEETQNSSFYAAAIGKEGEIDVEMKRIGDNVDAFLDDYVTADLGIYSGGADNRREHIKLYKLEFENETRTPEIDSEDLVYDVQVQSSPWEEYFE